MANKRLDDMTEAELAEFYQRHKDDDSLWGKVAVPMRRRRRGEGPSTSFAVRLAPDELTELKQAADERGTTLSDFIREASLSTARSQPANAVANRVAHIEASAKEQLAGELHAAVQKVVENFFSAADQK
jgi:hypothetical protein